MTTPIHSINAEDPKIDIFQKIHNSSILQEFVTQENIDMLWNIIIQNKAFQNSIQAQTTEGNSKLRNYYVNRIKEFVENIDARTNSLVDLNKMFIADFIRGFKPDNSNSLSNSSPKKIDLANSSPLNKEVITIEEIKNVRLNEFENQYEKMQSDFNMYRKNDVPSDVDFSDSSVVEPIKGEDTMKNIVVDTLQTRNTEETEFINSSSQISDEQTREWLNLKDVNGDSSVVENNSRNFVASDNSMIQQTSPVNSETPIINVEQRLAILEEKMDTMTNSISTLLAKIENNRSGDLLLSSENVIGNTVNTDSSRIPEGSVELNETESDELIELNLRPSPQFNVIV